MTLRLCVSCGGYHRHTDSCSSARQEISNPFGVVDFTNPFPEATTTIQIKACCQPPAEPEAGDTYECQTCGAEWSASVQWTRHYLIDASGANP